MCWECSADRDALDGDAGVGVDGTLKVVLGTSAETNPKTRQRDDASLRSRPGGKKSAQM
jgi:hypothetical protein